MLLQGIFVQTDVANVVHTTSFTMLSAHGDMVLFRVLCAVRTRLRGRWWFRCTYM